ncbi:MAG: excinuclease ABC subunit UvrC, partial [Acidobacteria bacterium]|nr:excinuclease ABC subunit UvrC [Acidobacteriota bacterium]
METRLKDQIRELPDMPGIYIFRDAKGRPLYVGKAKSLKKRVASYRRLADDRRLAMMVEEATGLEFVQTDSEAEALLLENNWIKKHKPRYNVLLRDDKTYPYVKLTLRDAYPRVAFTRRIFKDGAEYFGPFLPGGLARRAIKLSQKLFGIRVCTIEIDGTLPRPCLYYDMKRCLGPCVEGLTSQAAYDRAIEDARLFLSGRTEQLSRQLKQEMQQASAALEYEHAARLRDTLAEIDSVTQKRSLSSLRGEDVDIYGAHLAGANAAVAILVMRGGRVLDRRELFWERRPDLTLERLLSELLPQVYDRTTFIPKEIHLPVPIEGEEALIEWLSERKGERVYLRLPVRGPKAHRVQVACRNAELAHRRRFRADSGAEAAVGALAKLLGLSDKPTRIEGIDISNLQGAEMVGSLVVWEGGRILKKDYRSFNLRNMAGQDDFAAIHQVVSRRYRRVLEEVGSMPDLILIDGGRGQLNAALEALAELGVEETPILGLAKRDEEIYLPATPEPLRLPRRNPGLRLLQQIRDEAHRFAVSRHRQRRSKRVLASRLDDLPGIGPRRRKALLKTFGSLEGVRAADL